MHCILGWNLEAENEFTPVAEQAMRACFEEFPSVEALPRFHVIQVWGYGQQERILHRLTEVASAHAAANITFILSPLIIGGLYQGRLFDADLAEGVNALTGEE